MRFRQQQSRRRRLPILMYHGVIEDECDWGQWTQLPVNQFSRQIEFLDSKYTIIRLHKAVSALMHGDDLPPRAAVITFDDGFRNVYSRAFPVLRDAGVPATVFLTTSLIDNDSLLWTDELFCLFQSTEKRDLSLNSTGVAEFVWESHAEREQVYLELLSRLKGLPVAQKEDLLGTIREQLGPIADDSPLASEFRGMSWDEAREMQAGGLIDFGAHTVSHQILSQLDDDQQMREIGGSCERVHTELGNLSPVFAYPNGQPDDFNARTVQCLKSCGMDSAVTTIDGLASAVQDPFELRRIPIGNDASLLRCRLACNGSIEKLQNMRSRWRRCWSSVKATGSVLLAMNYPKLREI